MLKKTSLLASLIIINLTIGSSVSFAKEPKNLDFIKARLIKYHDSGEYQKDQAKVIDQAMLFLKTRIATEKKSHTPRKLAIILDIDDTSLSNYPNMLKMDFGGTFDQIVALEDLGIDPVIQPTLELFRYAKENNIAVFFVTGRKEHSKDAAIKNLNDAGYKNWDGIYFKPDNYHEKSPSPYKISKREEVEKLGYVIILNLGDQESDLVGKHAEKTFKLPNPYYFIP